MRWQGGLNRTGRVLAGVVVGVCATVTLHQAEAGASERSVPSASTKVARGADGVLLAHSPQALIHSLGRGSHVHHLHIATATPRSDIDPKPAQWTGGADPIAGVKNGAESTNWSGEVDIDATFTGVLGEWTVPTVPPSTGNQYSGTWVGVDGATNTSLIQVGTSQNSGSGTTSYNAWYEILPASEVPLPQAVSPGDFIEAAIGEVSASDWEIDIADVTAGWEDVGDFAYGGPGATAEWIDEAPTVSNVQSTLANFGTMTFSDLGVSSPDASGSGLVPVSMAKANGIVIAYPGAYNETSDSFPVTFGTPAPVVDSVTPSLGSTSGGTSVVINGDYLTGASAVDVGTSSVPFTVNPDNSLTVTTPAESAGTVDVTVTTPGGTSIRSVADQFTYVQAATQAITSAGSATAIVGSSFSFTVSTSGAPVPSITAQGKLPKHLKLVNKGDGTATVSGTPSKAGVSHLTVKATFGKGRTKHVVTQAFTLTVNPAP